MIYVVAALLHAKVHEQEPIPIPSIIKVPISQARSSYCCELVTCDARRSGMPRTKIHRFEMKVGFSEIPLLYLSSLILRDVDWLNF